MRRAISLLSSTATAAAASSSSSALSVRNTQRKVAVDVALLRRRADSVLRSLRLSDYALDVWVTTDASMRRLNRQYRAQDKATDILSFPFQTLAAPPCAAVLDPQLRPLPPPCPHSGVRDLGQMVISAPYVQRAAAELSQTTDQRLRALLVHGICHLLGYDHEQTDQALLMEAEENRIMQQLERQEAEIGAEQQQQQQPSTTTQKEQQQQDRQPMTHT